MVSIEVLDRPIAFHRVFAKVAGSVAGGVFLSQAYYWQQRTSHEGGWWWHTTEEWEEETCLTRRQLDTVRKRLKQLGILQEERRGVPAKLWYRLDLEVLHRSVQTSLADSYKLDSTKPPNKIGGNVQTISETTAETTSEKKTPSGSKKTGGRLPEGWAPPEKDWQMACEMIGERRSQTELDKFRDYWIAQPGQKGVKLDWSATWRNWIRKAAESVPQDDQPRKTPIGGGI